MSIKKHTHKGYYGGGLLIFDDLGMWCVGEEKGGEVLFSDLGGRYNFLDGHIHQTIAREVSEETCFVIQLTKKNVETFLLHPKTRVLCLYSGTGIPIYKCICVHISQLELLGYNKANFTADFHKSRKEIIIENSKIDETYYPRDFLYIPFADVKSKKISSRLEGLFKNSTIKL